MDNKNKKLVLIVALVAIILVIILLIIRLNVIKRNEQYALLTANENVVENAIDNTENNEIVENDEVENDINQSASDENDNESDNTPVADSKQEVDNQTIKKQESNQEKAVSIAKKDWGDDNNVYFSFENINSDGKYVVSVREISTTRTLRNYIIDISKGTFKIEE